RSASTRTGCSRSTRTSRLPRPSPARTSRTTWPTASSRSSSCSTRISPSISSTSAWALPRSARAGRAGGPAPRRRPSIDEASPSMKRAAMLLALAVASPVAAQTVEEAASFESLPQSALGDPSGEPAAEEPEIAPVAPLHERVVVSSSPRTLLGRQGALWLEARATAGTPRGDDVALFGGERGLRYRVTESIVADVSWGLTWASTHVAGEATVGGMLTPYEASHERVEPGNPTLGGAFVHRSEGSLLEVGLSLGIPTASRADAGG